MAAAEGYNKEGASSLEYQLEKGVTSEMTTASGVVRVLIHEALARH